MDNRLCDGNQNLTKQRMQIQHADIRKISMQHIDTHPRIPYKAKIVLIIEIHKLTLSNLNHLQVYTPFAGSVVFLPQERLHLPAH